MQVARRAQTCAGGTGHIHDWTPRIGWRGWVCASLRWLARAWAVHWTVCMDQLLLLPVKAQYVTCSLGITLARPCARQGGALLASSIPLLGAACQPASLHLTGVDRARPHDFPRD